jgi:crotonobetainyl-CoA:carnitine CoA-transferase CaiB-like acyl-CoA transferase
MSSLTRFSFRKQIGFTPLAVIAQLRELLPAGAPGIGGHRLVRRDLREGVDVQEHSSMSTSSGWPLAGMRVIDLSVGIAGAYCTKMLVDAGADVIKVEPPGGDPLRRWTASGALIPDGEDGALFQHLNASKRSAVADIETAAGRALALDLAATADLIVESSGPGTLARLGLTLDVLQACNAAVSLVSISPWGSTGPWAGRPATEFTLQAATGSTAYRGLTDRVPVAAGGSIGEWIAGTFAALGALVAWLSARNTGKGQHVDLSMFEAMLLGMTIYHDLAGQWRKEPLRRAIEIPSIEPAKDSWVGFCTITGQQWKDFCLLIGHPEVGEDPRYLDGAQRMADLAFMQRIIHGWTRQHTVDEITERATQLRIPVAPIGNGENLPRIDHFVARRVFVNGPGGFLRPRPPYQLGETQLRPFGRAPKLGEHTDEVMEELSRKSSLLGKEGSGGPALPLAGLRVIELTSFWAGPLTASHLADLGADVVKVESIQRPDGMRFAGALPVERMWEWSPVFAGANVGKRDITLNLTTVEGMGLLKRLLASADVVIDNFSARVLENFGLTWEQVHALNARIIMMRMPAFGLDGPWRDRTGFAMTVEQVSGMAWITGYEDMPLVVRGACDPLAALHAVFALLMALEHRRRTGAGQLVEVPLVETALNVAAEQVIEYSAYGQVLRRAGNRGPCAAPQGVYGCADADEYVAVAVVTDAQWVALRGAMGDPDWARDPALATAAGRRAAHDTIDAHLERWLAPQGRDAAVEKLVGAGVPAHALINAHFVMPNPQLEARCFFQVMVHPVTGTTRYPGLPMAFSGLPRNLHSLPPPTLGQHNDEILGGELGLSPDEMQDLRQRKIIGERPAFM